MTTRDSHGSFFVARSHPRPCCTMIIITRPHVTDAEIDHIRERIEAAGMRTHLSRGEHRTVIGCIGDESLLAELPLRSLAGVESVTPVLKPYQMASLELPASRTVI